MEELRWRRRGCEEESSWGRRRGEEEEEKGKRRREEEEFRRRRNPGRFEDCSEECQASGGAGVNMQQELEQEETR